MNLFLLILIAVMVLVTMVCAIITTIITVKASNGRKIVDKVLTISAVVLVIAAIIGLAFGVSHLKKDAPDKYESVTLETAGFNEVSINEYIELLNDEEESIVLVARPTCSFCEKFTPILKEAADDMNLTINYLNTDDFTEEDWKAFQDTDAYLQGDEWGTPLTMIVSNGSLVDYNNGYVELDEIKEFFTNNGLGE